jgi:hypothetical protein
MDCMLRHSVDGLDVCLLRKNILEQWSAKSVSEFNYVGRGACFMQGRRVDKSSGDIRCNRLHKHCRMTTNKIKIED